MRNLAPYPLNQTTAGFTLLEVLVAIIILSFGVLGAVGLQASSLQANREARLQSTGLRLAEELAEMMRSNHTIAIKTAAADNPYIYNATSTLTNPNCGLPTASTASCGSALAIAQRDMREWLFRVLNELPGARVVVCRDATPYESSTGLPEWTCSNTGDTFAIKIGWTRANTLRGATGTDATATGTTNSGAFDKALRPAVILPLIPGSA